MSEKKRKVREAFSSKLPVQLHANHPNPLPLSPSLPARPGRQPPMLYCAHSISQLMAQHVNTKESAGHTKHIITAQPPITDTGLLQSHLLLQMVRLRRAGHAGVKTQHGRKKKFWIWKKDMHMSEIIIVWIIIALIY